MAQEEIEIEISPSGQVTVRTIGIKGPRCIDAAEFLAQIVGREVSRELTSEYTNRMATLIGTSTSSSGGNRPCNVRTANSRQMRL